MHWFQICFTISLTSLNRNLEHGLVTLTESFSPAQICLTQPLLLESKAEVRAKPCNSLLYSALSASLIWF